MCVCLLLKDCVQLIKIHSIIKHITCSILGSCSAPTTSQSHKGVVLLPVHTLQIASAEHNYNNYTLHYKTNPIVCLHSQLCMASGGYLLHTLLGNRLHLYCVVGASLATVSCEYLFDRFLPDWPGR